MDTKVCTQCLTEKPLEDFPWKNIAKRTRQAACKVCVAKASAEWYENNRQHHIENVNTKKARRRELARAYVFEYLKTHPCENCGLADPLVLEFHHTEGKEINMSNLINDGPTIIRVIQELHKCRVLCANCHRRLTAQERGWWKGKQ